MDVRARLVGTARNMCPVQQDVLELDKQALPRWLGRGTPRWFVPMGNWRIRRSGSKVYPALRWRARAYRAALRAWITLGGARVTHHVGAKREGGWPLGELLLADMPTLSTAAVSIGIPGPAQKITLQLMDSNGRILGFAKYADNPYTKRLLTNEAQMLERLPENVAPRLIRFARFLEGVLLVQTPLRGRPRTPRPRLDPAQVKLFNRLVRPGEAYAVSGHPFVESLRAQADGGPRDKLEAVVEAFEDSEWPAAWMHGDMAPWNMHWWRGSCLAFDWEHGTERGFAYLDAAATLIQVASVMKRADPWRAKRAVSRELEERLPAGYCGLAPAVAALSAVNMLVSWYPPRKPDAFEAWLGAFIEAPP